MGTRSRIAVANEDGSFISIYCHWDGYPGHVGALLSEHYADESTARKLMELGDLSSLDISIGEKHDFNGRVDGMCNAYGRDRGETDIEAKASADLAALNELTQGCGGEYLYVLRAGQWYVGEGGMSAFGMPASKAPGELRLLSEVLAESTADED